ncbi:hypothetical protein LG634_01790 [Streptomyces bambusae]|uniref:hypothetical protein n=1 Tax=Streptomyces bambusae TaxID=1550616 RepID=UPI001CFEA21B|nr:hypothetical protein [Streptomyces bambusae]MCB5163578.1 hypothetical protein [Streptomyces bambusae]
MMAATRSPALRVVHLPARTPYARKLHSQDILILNETAIRSGVTVPAAVNASWLLAHTPLDWLDVLHLHHIDVEDLPTLERLLDACARSGVRVVFTAHDTRPMYGSAMEFAARLQLLLAADVQWVCLTESSLVELACLLGDRPPATVIPHGYVVPPDALLRREREQGSPSARFLMYGASRASRDQLSPVINWSLGVTDPRSTLRLLLRAFSPVDFAPDSRIPLLLETARHDPRIRLSMRPYPSDDDVVDAGLAADVLLLPYLWGSHSGQLELAFDLNLLPVCSRTGHLPEQYRHHQGLVSEPEWFDWSTGHPNLFGERFLTAVENATARMASSTSRGLDRTFLDYRAQEHKSVIDAYAQIYGGDR